MHNFRELRVWKMGIALSKSIFQCTRTFPVEERYLLTSQLLRCSTSIPSNIAEGCGRSSQKELNYFLSVALGSAFELETQVVLAYEFGYLDKATSDNIFIQINEIQKMIGGLKKSLVL